MRDASCESAMVKTFATGRLGTPSETVAVDLDAVYDGDLDYGKLAVADLGSTRERGGGVACRTRKSVNVFVIFKNSPRGWLRDSAKYICAALNSGC